MMFVNQNHIDKKQDPPKPPNSANTSLEGIAAFTNKAASRSSNTVVS